MKKRYLDYAGLKRVLKRLLPPIDAKPTCHDTDGNLVKDQKIVELTKAQFDALLTKDPDTYYMVNDDNETKACYPHPDWAKAVSITTEQLKAGYIVPGDGMIIGNVINHSDTTVDGDAGIQINGIEVTQTHTIKIKTLTLNTIVNKDDTVKLVLSGGWVDSDVNVYAVFVPWKA